MNTKRLTIKKETLRRLGAQDLNKVGGGAATQGTGTCNCSQYTCDTYSACTFVSCCYGRPPTTFC
jgi:hypothetical protein